jgi:pantoate--beta-alanine ligase
MSKPVVVHTIADLRSLVASWRAAGETIGLAPTMGALHDGHVSLVNLLSGLTRRSVVSIFVNPTQFAPNEDFSKYPRTFEADLARLETAGVDAVFNPSAADMYPAGFTTTITTGGPASAGLEDRFRPTHFAGVATVVAKLLIQCGPDAAIFGEKDYQQLAVIRRMARDLDLPVAIHGAPTVREPDGLALSSRNRYLEADERRQAPALIEAMRTAASAIRGGLAIGPALARARNTVEAAGFAIDYIEVRDAASLAPVEAADGRALRLLAAARLGRTRLIDNIAIE